VITVVSRNPVCTADVTKLITASTGHVIAALILLNNKPAVLALAVVKVVLKKLHLMLVAQSFVLCQQTLGAELRLTRITDHDSISNDGNDSFAVLLGTQLFVGIVGRLVELMYLSVVLLDVDGELLKEEGAGIDEGVAAVPRTGDFLKHFDLVDDVVVQAGLAEVALVLALAQK